MSIIIKIGKKAKAVLKKTVFRPEAKFLSYARRIERVKTDQRICAMTFDDGPTNLPARPSDSEIPLTALLLDCLSEYGAKGTFDIIGTTRDNYPDKPGRPNTPQWGGIRYDHYPEFGMDLSAGAESCEALLQRIVREGHQLANHSYRHILFGKKRWIYGGRVSYSCYQKVSEDLQTLDRLVLERCGTKMTLARPPHYVDPIANGLTAYDAYAQMGYDYLAASFDGAGWLPMASYEEEVRATHLPLARALQADPDALRGQIIFQKDGYNMALRTPVADGLPKQLALLRQHGYRVVTVGELLQYSQFADIAPEDPDYAAFVRLLDAKPIAYNDNTVRPDRPMTRGELAMLLSDKAHTVDRRIHAILTQAPSIFQDVKPVHPYSGAIQYCAQNNLLSGLRGSFYPDKILTPADLSPLSSFFADTKEMEARGFSRRSVLRNFTGQPLPGR